MSCGWEEWTCNSGVEKDEGKSILRHWRRKDGPEIQGVKWIKSKEGKIPMEEDGKNGMRESKKRERKVDWYNKRRGLIQTFLNERNNFITSLVGTSLGFTTSHESKTFLIWKQVWFRYTFLTTSILIPIKSKFKQRWKKAMDREMDEGRKKGRERKKERVAKFWLSVFEWLSDTFVHLGECENRWTWDEKVIIKSGLKVNFVGKKNFIKKQARGVSKCFSARYSLSCYSLPVSLPPSLSLTKSFTMSESSRNQGLNCSKSCCCWKGINSRLCKLRRFLHLSFHLNCISFSPPFSATNELRWKWEWNG